MFLSIFLEAQEIKPSPIEILKNNAIEIENLENLNHEIYNEIKDYEIIMVGEMHGTYEPAKFAYGLCKLIAKNEGNVILVLELPKELLGDLSHPISSEDLMSTNFFQMENTDGRNGQSWFELILKSGNKQGIIVETLDNNICTPRDSSMYLDVIRIKKKYPNTKIVTLTGNIHNWLLPFRNQLKLGSYLLNDNQNINSRKIMSINHMYKEGTMMNNTGNGLELRNVEGKDNFLNETIKSKIYLTPQLFEKQKQYTHILYTEKITHSEKMKINENK